MLRIPSSSRRRRAAVGRVVVLAGLLGGCERAEIPPPASDPSSPDGSLTAPSAPEEGQLVFDREFLFLSLEADSLVIVPWFFRASVDPEGVHREQAAWLSQATEWEVIAQETMDTPPTRSPWRIIPGERIRLIVGPDDRVESLLLRDPPRELETVLGDLMTEWANPGAESIRLYRARTLFPAGPIDGLVIEISRRWEASESGGPGDWVFVHSGTDLQFFMEGAQPVERIGSPVRYDGWTRIALRDLQWRDLELDWEETRAFESARRDVPVRWSIGTPEGQVTGSLESLSSHLMVGQGDGPILPLIGLFEVVGVMEVQGREFSVTGMIRHVQR